MVEYHPVSERMLKMKKTKNKNLRNQVYKMLIDLGLKYDPEEKCYFPTENLLLGHYLGETSILDNVSFSKSGDCITVTISTLGGISDATSDTYKVRSEEDLTKIKGFIEATLQGVRTPCNGRRDNNMMWLENNSNMLTMLKLLDASIVPVDAIRLKTTSEGPFEDPHFFMCDGHLFVIHGDCRISRATEVTLGWDIDPDEPGLISDDFVTENGLFFLGSPNLDDNNKSFAEFPHLAAIMEKIIDVINRNNSVWFDPDAVKIDNIIRKEVDE